MKKKLFRGTVVWSNAGKKATTVSPIDFAQKMEELGVGEIIVQSIERDGSMLGYDLDLITSISKAVKIPVVALGGAGTIEHLEQGFDQGYANGLAAGSLFVYHGSKKGVLINYPTKSELHFKRTV